MKKLDTDAFTTVVGTMLGAMVGAAIAVAFWNHGPAVLFDLPRVGYVPGVCTVMAVRYARAVIVKGW